MIFFFNCFFDIRYNSNVLKLLDVQIKFFSNKPEESMNQVEFAICFLFVFLSAICNLFSFCFFNKSFVQERHACSACSFAPAQDHFEVRKRFLEKRECRC